MRGREKTGKGGGGGEVVREIKRDEVTEQEIVDGRRRSFGGGKVDHLPTTQVCKMDPKKKKLKFVIAASVEPPLLLAAYVHCATRAGNNFFSWSNLDG